MDIGEAVRARILELCRERNLSINKLCLLSGVTQSTVNNIVSGRNHSATVTTIKKLCDGLGISIDNRRIFQFGVVSRTGSRSEVVFVSKKH